MKVLGISAGALGGSAEIALKEALRAAQAGGAEVELVRLAELALPLAPTAGEADDVWWVWERILDADGIVVSCPILSRMVPASLKVVMDRLLGPNADRAIVEKMLELRAAGQSPAMPFRLDERVIRDRVAGFIAVGGSLTPQWKTLVLAELHTMTFSMQIAVVDQFVISGTGTPRSVVLDQDALARAAQLGRHVAGQLGRPFAEADYAGEPGLCPLCHLSTVCLDGLAVTCACGARGTLRPEGTVAWTDLDTSVISMAEKAAHYDEILQTAERHAAHRELTEERAAAYDQFHPVVTP